LVARREAAVPTSNEESITLARRLRALRERGLGTRVTQQSLASALSQDQPLTPPVISTWENATEPVVPPASRLRAYARFFASQRSIESTPRLLSDHELDDEESEERVRLERELLALRNAAVEAAEDMSLVSIWSFVDSGPVTIICPDFPEDDRPEVGRSDHPNYTDAFNYADVDALIELFGHVRAENPSMQVSYRRASQINPDDLSGHIVLLGGVGWNSVTRRILDRLSLPVRQVKSDPDLPSGDPFELEIDGQVRRLYPQWSPDNPDELIEDIAELVRQPNPHNSRRTLTICNGIHSRGVLGAVRCLTDTRMRETNERYLAQRFGSADDFGLLLRVDVVSGRSITPDLNQSDRRIYEWSGGDRKA
jgi:hypothetical protein